MPKDADAPEAVPEPEAVVGSATPEPDPVAVAAGQVVVRLAVNIGDHRAGDVVAVDDDDETRAQIAAGLAELA